MRINPVDHLFHRTNVINMIIKIKHEFMLVNNRHLVYMTTIHIFYCLYPFSSGLKEGNF